MSRFAELLKDADVGDVHVATEGKGKKRRPPAQIDAKCDDTAKAARALHPLDDQTSYSPFPFDPHAMASLRPDQTPRFLGTLTNPELLDEKEVALDDLTAMQNRVGTAKVTDLAGKPDTGKPPVVVRANGRHYIADGHHRLSAAWLRGDKTAKVRFKDLEPTSNAMKRATVTVAKVDDEIGVIYGWASVIEEGGRTVTDVQGDQISEPDLIKAAHGFMQNHRVGGLMHAQEDGAAVKGGDVVESLVLTRDLQKALGIDLGKTGWLIGYRPHDPKILELAKSGFLPAFSIGGRGVRKPV